MNPEFLTLGINVHSIWVMCVIKSERLFAKSICSVAIVKKPEFILLRRLAVSQCKMVGKLLGEMIKK